MTQENRTVKKSRFIWALIAIFVLSGVVSAFAAPDSEEICEATRELLSVVHNASVEEVVRLIQEGADVNAVVVVNVIDYSRMASWYLRYLRFSGNHGMTPLMLAVQSNPNPDILRALIENGADVNTSDGRGRTPLTIAASSDSNPDVMRILIESGANVNAVDNYGNEVMTSLILSASSNSNPGVLQILIENGADVNASDTRARTPLMLAAMNNSNPDVLRFLIESGADANAVDIMGKTPLAHWITGSNSNVDALRVLIESGADVNITYVIQNRRWIPLLFAVQGNLSLDVVRILIENGADVNAVGTDMQSNFRQTPLAFAIRQNNPNLYVVRLLIESGADVNASYVVASQRRTPLLSAIQHNNLSLDIVQLLIEGGANVSATCHNGLTPLTFALNSDVARILIENGADVNAIARNGRTVLMLTQNPDIVQLLIERGADVNAADDNGRTPLAFASNYDVARILIENSANVNAVNRHGSTTLMWVAGNNSEPDVLRILIESGAGVNAISNTGMTPLMHAALRRRPNPDVLRILIENGADINAADEAGRTPLMFAARPQRPQYYHLNFDVLRILIEGGADVNVTDSEGVTPLLFIASAASRGAYSNLNPDIVRILVENGADVNVTDSEERTPLLLFADARHNSIPEIVLILIENGADVNAVDNMERTPLMLAAERSPHPDVLLILLENGADVNVADNEGRTPLLWATKNSHSQLDVLLALVENGSDVNAADNEGITQLMYAIKHYPNPEFIRILIENGADISAVDNTGRTPLMFSAIYNSYPWDVVRQRWEWMGTGSRVERNLSPDVLQILIENGADVNAVDNTGRTPLIWAAKRNSNPDVLRVLINSGADIGIRDKEGRRVIDFAETNEQLMRTRAFNLRGAGIGGDVNLNLYHPWNRSAQLARLDSPASFRISDNFPRLDGATSTYPLYAAVANEVFAVSDKSELQRYLFCSRTENAYNRLIQGEVDMIFVLQPSDEQLELARNAGVELHFTPIARDGFVFFVNSQNPVSNLSIREIQDIYLGRITNWQGVGGNDRVILPFQRPANSGSQTAMINEVMRGKELPPPLKNHHSFTMGGMIRDVATFRDQEESIGYSFRFFVEQMMQSSLRIDLMPIDERQSARETLNPIRLLAVDGIAPTTENIRDGTYPLTVDVFAVTAGTTNPHVPKLIEWLLSPEGQELVERTGYVGVKMNRN